MLTQTHPSVIIYLPHARLFQSLASSSLSLPRYFLTLSLTLATSLTLSLLLTLFPGITDLTSIVIDISSRRMLAAGSAAAKATSVSSSIKVTHPS